MDNLYQAPSAPLLDNTEDGGFFVVSISKLTVLFVATFGLYSVYWFYRQWCSQRSSMTDDIWPIPRAIFPIFFVHALSRRMTLRLEAQSIDTPRYDDAATWFVVFSVVGVVLGRLAVHITLPSLASMAVDQFGLLCLLPMMGLQRKANQASGDAEGASNSRFTLANMAWLLLGAVVWVGWVSVYGFG